jgi:hypothetical protein
MTDSPAFEDLSAAARHLGVEFDAQAARTWILAVSAADRARGWTQEAATGVFGSHLALADFNQADLDYFRQLAQRVRLARHPAVESAIAIAGSSAQGKIQLFPGDADFFERVNIKAPDEAAARVLLRELMRQTALRALAETDIVLIEANFGVYPWPATRAGAAHAAGESILWLPDEALSGVLEITDAAGVPCTLRWDEVAAGLGWSYLGWIVADPDAGRIALASNMLDATWESPSGAIVPLDGSLDAFFQEIYLEPEALPVFTKIARHLDPAGAQGYAAAMRQQVHYYVNEDPSYCKATKRLYNLFRLTDELEAAAYLRELFDEPGAQLYQVDGLLEAARHALDPATRLDRDIVLHQIEIVRQAVAAALDGPEEQALLAALARLSESFPATPAEAADWSASLRQCQAQCRALVNDYFRARLYGLPRIAAFLDGLQPDA